MLSITKQTSNASRALTLPAVDPLCQMRDAGMPASGSVLTASLQCLGSQQGRTITGGVTGSPGPRPVPNKSSQLAPGKSDVLVWASGHAYCKYQEVTQDVT